MIVLKPDVKKGFVAATDGAEIQKMTWSKLLARVFKIDIGRCLVCQARMPPESLELVTVAPLVAAILAGLGLNARPPSRAPPRQIAGDDDDIDQRPSFSE